MQKRTVEKYLNKIEKYLNTEKLREIQFKRLKRVLQYICKNSEYYRKRIDEAVKKIESFEDFKKYIPLFTKEDHRLSQEESKEKYGHSLGMHLCVPSNKIKLLSATSGTTGEPTFYIFNDEDLKIWCEGRARVYWRVGIRPGMKILIAFGFSMFVGGIPNVIASERYGLTVIPVGAEGGAERILKFANLTKPDVLMCTPSLAEYLIQKSPQILGCSVDKLGIKILLCGGEPGAGIPEVKERIGKNFNAKLYDFQGSNISCDYPEYQGIHRCMDDYHFYELINPDTKESIELEDGARGEGVITQLWKGAAPFIRYTAGDIHEVYTSPCPCGKTGIRYKIVGRVDDMLKVKGVIVYPAGIERVLSGFKDRITGEFRIVLNEPPPKVTPPLKIKIEVREQNLQNLENEIKDAMHKDLKFTPEIIFVEEGKLKSQKQKKEYFEKNY